MLPFAPAWHDAPAAVAASVFLALVLMRFGRKAAERRTLAGRFLVSWLWAATMFVPGYVVGRPFERGAELARQDASYRLLLGAPAGLACVVLVWSVPAVRRWARTVGRSERPEDVFT